jgi:tRNA pseudouridine-54 N-methylase
MDNAFIVIGHRAKANADFIFNDLPGSGGGIDTLARCIATAFCLSYGIRRGS